MTNDLRIKKDAPDTASYMTPSVTDLDGFTPENEDEIPTHAAIVQSGWDAARKGIANSNKGFATDFKFADDVQLIKFIGNDPMMFQQHWLSNRVGKKSFVSNGPTDPLCQIGSIPTQKFAFTVLNLSDDEPQLQLMIVGVRLCTQLEKLASDKKTGPLDRPDIYWAVSKSGEGTKTSYSLVPVKERDLQEDWDLDPVASAAFIKTLKPLGPEALHASTDAELAAIAREIGSI